MVLESNPKTGGSESTLTESVSFKGCWLIRMYKSSLGPFLSDGGHSIPKSGRKFKGPGALVNNICPIRGRPEPQIRRGRGRRWWTRAARAHGVCAEVAASGFSYFCHVWTQTADSKKRNPNFLSSPMPHATRGLLRTRREVALQGSAQWLRRLDREGGGC